MEEQPLHAPLIQHHTPIRQLAAFKTLHQAQGGEHQGVGGNVAHIRIALGARNQSVGRARTFRLGFRFGRPF